jgi:hypothetical protein
MNAVIPGLVPGIHPSAIAIAEIEPDTSPRRACRPLDPGHKARDDTTTYPRPPRLHYAASMRDEPLYIPPFSSTALYIFGHLQRRGGSMRIAPLLRELKLEDN